MDVPTVTLALLDESRVRPATDAAIRRLLCAAFPVDASIFSQTRAWHGSAPVFSFLAREGRRMVGYIGVVCRTILAGDRRVAVAGIQNLAVLPDRRGHGLGQRLTAAAMDEAGRRGIPFGLLFCVPGLEAFYNREGWRRLDVETLMDFDGQRNVPIPGKNICMVKNLTTDHFPAGNLHLLGPDW
jgi:predicted N-acetyltransferase YhbS